MDDRRRKMVTGTAALAAAVIAAGHPAGAEARKPRPPAAPEDPTATLRAAFARLSTTLNGGDVAGFLALFDERAVSIDEDAPFRFSKAEFIDHLGFHGNKNWEGFAWVPRETRYVVRGDTGLTAGGVTFRGKPVDAGFRLRHMLHTIGWHRIGADWRIICFHQTPLWGHLDGASPGTGG